MPNKLFTKHLEGRLEISLQNHSLVPHFAQKICRIVCIPAPKDSCPLFDKYAIDFGVIAFGKLFPQGLLPHLATQR